MRIFLTTIFAVIFTSVFPFVAQANEQTEVLKYCETKYNAQSQIKDCGCMVEKYFTKQKELSDKNVITYKIGDVFSYLEFDCHKYSAETLAEYKKCRSGPNVRKISRDTSAQDKFCHCYAQGMEKMPTSFEGGEGMNQMVMAEMKKQFREAMIEPCATAIEAMQQ